MVAVTRRSKLLPLLGDPPSQTAHMWMSLTPSSPTPNDSSHCRSDQVSCCCRCRMFL
ncbi:unnamed protein product [Musa acuminata subsp. burmannicoides]